MATIRREEVEERQEMESRSLDDEVVIGGANTKVSVYHEVNLGGGPKCSTYFDTPSEAKRVTRKEAMNKFLAPCFKWRCKESLDMSNDE